MFYGSISRGYKSGGFQGTLVFSPDNIIPFDEETVLSYEIGSKVTLAEGAVQLNSALFFYDYQNLQAQGTIEGGAGGVENLFALQNIGDAEVLGFEIDLTAAPTEGLDFAIGVGYLDAKIVDPFIAEVEVDGRPAMSPKWNVNGRARYSFARTENNFWFIQADFNYQDDVFFDIYETPFLHEDGYWVWNASAGIISSDNRWRATIWGRNLSNTDFRIGGFTGGVAGPVHVFGAPRTYGVSFSYNFH
jgi:iron complex outermembrane receptor protein